MCGITGILNLTAGKPPGESQLRQMLAMIRHRGPDEFGIYLDEHIGLGNARLSIIDLSGGQQPICNEDRTLWIVFNGEIFNYLELRPELESRGHRFTTHSDTEVLLHLYEEYGPRCLERLNGQFAFAIWNSREQTLFVARDRLGVRPLFFTRSNGSLIFGSEIKAILSDRRVQAEIDPITLDQIFTFWTPLSPRTIFKGIAELPPGHYLLAHGESFTIHRYWEMGFPCTDGPKSASTPHRTLDSYLEECEHLLVDAVRIRLRADVPVGAYLSGGLDSSIIATIIRNCSQNHLDTFSISFSDGAYDESLYQRQMAEFLGTKHQVVHATYSEIGRVFPDVIWHTEAPVMRTAPAPMFLLSKLVRDSGYKVVLTGEGADELLAGYDIFKEAKIRRFWAKCPESTRRPLLLGRLYSDIAELGRNAPLLSEFFRGELTDANSPTFSHAIRWRNNRRNCRFFSEGLKHELARQSSSVRDRITYSTDFARWGALEQAQYLETSIFMSQYLLSSQGDRVAMAHSVEGRYPFLDHRFVAFCSRLPANLKLRGLSEKYLLKQLGRKWLPEGIWRRPKRPYRSPILRSFFNAAEQDYVRDVLSPENVRLTGLFNPAAVGQLVRKAEQGNLLGETGDMALVGIVSSQLVHRQFVQALRMPPPLLERESVRVCVGSRSILPP